MLHLKGTLGVRLRIKNVGKSVLKLLKQHNFVLPVFGFPLK